MSGERGVMAGVRRLVPRLFLFRWKRGPAALPRTGPPFGNRCSGRRVLLRFPKAGRSRDVPDGGVRGKGAALGMRAAVNHQNFHECLLLGAVLPQPAA